METGNHRDIWSKFSNKFCENQMDILDVSQGLDKDTLNHSWGVITEWGGNYTVNFVGCISIK